MTITARRLLPALAATAAALGACAPMGVKAVDVHDITLYGLNERHVLFYGDEAGGTRSLTVNGQTVSVAPASTSAPAAAPAKADGNAFAPVGTLTVNGAASLRLPAGPAGEPASVATVPLSGDLSVSTRATVQGVYYYDGRRWLGVSGPLGANVKQRLSPAVRTGLRGVGALSDVEADALALYLATRGPVAVALLAPGQAVEAPLTVTPPPRDVQRTVLYVQTGVPTDVLGGLAGRPPAATRRDLGAGGNSAYAGSAPAVHLDASAAALAGTWRLVGGNQLPAPSPPAVDFARESVVTVFLGQKPTGGYGLTVTGLSADGSTLVVSVTVRQPGPGVIVTQSLTSPYVAFAVPAGFTGVRVVDAGSGQVIAQANAKK